MQKRKFKKICLTGERSSTQLQPGHVSFQLPEVDLPHNCQKCDVPSLSQIAATLPPAPVKYQAEHEIGPTVDLHSIAIHLDQEALPSYKARCPSEIELQQAKDRAPAVVILDHLWPRIPKVQKAFPYSMTKKRMESSQIGANAVPGDQTTAVKDRMPAASPYCCSATPMKQVSGSSVRTSGTSFVWVPLETPVKVDVPCIQRVLAERQPIPLSVLKNLILL